MPQLAATPVPDAFETRTNATFGALMWALSRPGTVQDLPSDDPTLIAEALIDRECRVWCADPVLSTRIARFGAQLVPVALADHVFLPLADMAALDLVAQVPVGSELYPDAGATIIAPAGFGQGQRLCLTGPGIETKAVIALDGIDPGFWPLRSARCRYPIGFDLFLTCGAQVMGLPRSTRIEVL